MPLPLSHSLYKTLCLCPSHGLLVSPDPLAIFTSRFVAYAAILCLSNISLFCLFLYLCLLSRRCLSLSPLVSLSLSRSLLCLSLRLLLSFNTNPVHGKRCVR